MPPLASARRDQLPPMASARSSVRLSGGWRGAEGRRHIAGVARRLPLRGIGEFGGDKATETRIRKAMKRAWIRQP